MYPKRFFYIILIAIHLLSMGVGYTQTVFPKKYLSEHEARNTQIFYFHINEKLPSLSAKEYFKPYLAYMDTNKVYHDKMMDAFLFLDLSYKNYGLYNKKEWSSYLDDIFVKTKLPIKEVEKTSSGFNNYVVLGNIYSAGINYKIDDGVEKGTYSISFDVRTIPVSFFPSQTALSNDLILGVECFDSNGEKIFTEPSGFSYSSALNMCYRYLNFDETRANIWQSINTSFNINSDCKSFRVYVVNWGLDKYYKVAIDNFLIKYNNKNCISEVESRFDSDIVNSKWEYNKNIKIKHLFDSREALIDELNRANYELSELNIPQTKLILQIPEIGFDIYSAKPALKEELKINLLNYIEEIYSKYTNWLSLNPNSKVKLIGLYYIDENIRVDEVAFYKEIFEHMKQKMNSFNWKLFASPYNGFYSYNINSSYADEIIPVFDLLWQQPNAFYNFRYGNIDPDLLKKTNRLSSIKNLAINIENRVISDGEEYGRINDYFDFGTKFGYANYSKLYYDNAGAHIANSFSKNPKQRVDYDNLYKFIKQSEQGCVINGDFEIRDEVNLSKLHYWNGNYTIKENVNSFNVKRKLEFSTENNKSIYSIKYPLKDNQQYKVTLYAKERQDDQIANSALLGVRFYDKSFNVLSDSRNSNLSYSNHLESNYKYLQTSTEYRQFEVLFIPPENSVYFELFLQKWGNSTIDWKAIKIIENELASKSKIIYQFNDSLYINSPVEIGNKSLDLAKNNYASSYERIPVIANKEYRISISSREKLPVQISEVAYKALIGVELFDESGSKISPQPLLPNMNFSSALNMNYFYLGNINQDWNDNIRKTQFPSSVKTIKLYIRNWYYDNGILFDNLLFSLTDNDSFDFDRTLNTKNLLKKSNWSQKTPLTITQNEPVFYRDFIDVSAYSNYIFSAMIKGRDVKYANEDFIGAEFYDGQYNLLTDKNLSTNMNYSDEYQHWISPRIDISSINCEDYFLQDTNRNTFPNWYNNQWIKYQYSFEKPQEAKFMKLFFVRKSNMGEFYVLNPELYSINQSVHSSVTSNFAVIDSEKESEKSIFPNPVSTVFYLSEDDFNEYNSITISDLNGRILFEPKRVEKSINVSYLTKGTYLINLSGHNRTKTVKFIKK